MKIPLEDDLVRCVPWGRLRKDADDNVIGIEAAAFRLRPDEAFLSAAWIQFFRAATRNEQLIDCIRVLRKSRTPTPPRGGYAIGNVTRILAACAARSRPVRIVHEPEDDNAAHVAVRRWPHDDDLLFEEMARSIWSELLLNKDAPA